MSARAARLIDNVEASDLDGVLVQVDGELVGVSLGRLLLRGENAGPERDVSAHLQAALGNRIQDHGGTFLPPGVLFPRADLDTGTAGAGAEFTFEARPDLVPGRRPVPRVEALGATFIRGGRDTLQVARVTGGSTVAWVPEVPGSDVSEDDLTLDEETIDLKLGMITSGYSRRLRAVNRETAALVESELGAAAASAIDEGAVAGAGGDEPTGLLNRSDVPTHSIADPDGGAPTYTDMTAVEEAPAAADVDELAAGWLTTPGVRRKLRETEEFAGAGPIWRGRFVLGRPGEVSSVVPSDLTKGAGTALHGLLFSADWSNLVVHVLAVEIVTDPFTQKDQGLIEATMFLHIGVGLRHPEAFVKVVDADVS